MLDLQQEGVGREHTNARRGRALRGREGTQHTVVINHSTLEIKNPSQKGLRILKT